MANFISQHGFSFFMIFSLIFVFFPGALYYMGKKNVDTENNLKNKILKRLLLILSAPMHFAIVFTILMSLTVILFDIHSTGFVRLISVASCFLALAFTSVFLGLNWSKVSKNWCSSKLSILVRTYDKLICVN